MPDFLDDEEPTKPEATETLAETLERLRSRTATKERPGVRRRNPTEEQT